MPALQSPPTIVLQYNYVWIHVTAHSPFVLLLIQLWLEMPCLGAYRPPRKQEILQTMSMLTLSYFQHQLSTFGQALRCTRFVRKQVTVKMELREILEHSKAWDQPNHTQHRLLPTSGLTTLSLRNGCSKISWPGWYILYL
jgi:hypothetical protein